MSNYWHISISVHRRTLSDPSCYTDKQQPSAQDDLYTANSNKDCAVMQFKGYKDALRITSPPSVSISMNYLRLLDLSAAFDTIDHAVLLDRLSLWFGIYDAAFYWFKSYLCFHIVYSASNVHMVSLNLTKLAMAYHKAQYYTWTLLFTLHTTPLSSLIF